MKKILPFIVIGALILSGIGAVGLTSEVAVNNYDIDNKVEKSELETLTFSSLAIESNKEYIDVSLNGISTYSTIPGCPIMPRVIKSVELPFGVSNVNVEVSVKNVKELDIEGIIRPAPPHIPLIETDEPIVVDAEINEAVYSSSEPYPSEWFDYRVTSGLNDNYERVTHVIIPVYPVRYSPASNKLLIAEDAEIKITYDESEIDTTPTEEEYDMVIIAPLRFSLSLNRLKNHKNRNGIKTFIKTTGSIYREYEGVDKPEEIKLFIEEAIRKHNIKYVLLVGGLKNKVLANPREHRNYGARDWHVPVRYHNFYDDPKHPLSYESIFDPGVISDLYFADVYKEGGVFNDWDPNGDGIIAAWGMDIKGFPDVENDTGLDMDPDVSVGRLACRNIMEVRAVVNKIIKYEKTTYGKEWFEKMVLISGDGFLDQEDLDFQWDTNGLPDGEYTIIAQSRKPEYEAYGEPDIIHVTLDRTQETKLTFNHDDWERIDKYPDEPIAEIVSVSDGNILGYNDNDTIIGEGQAYGNSATNWANLNYTSGILHIRGKTYDPSAYGNVTNIHVWILNEEGEIVFDDWRNGSEMYYEGEWVTGEKTLLGGGGAAYYIPENFEKDIVWASNGKLTGTDDIINSLKQGSGFAFLSGHGSPSGWSDHYPGIPGNRGHGSFSGLSVIAFKRNFPYIQRPWKMFPMEQITNYNKFPVVLIGGCHNSQFNVTMIPGMLDTYNEKNTWCHGAPVPECFSWYLIKMPHKGAIATIGNTGLGYGVPGKTCLVEGLDGGICIEFFKQYGIEYEENDGSAILGDVYRQALHEYNANFDMDFLDHAKSLTQWVLLGDPSLMLGGYSS